MWPNPLILRGTFFFIILSSSPPSFIISPSLSPVFPLLLVSAPICSFVSLCSVCYHCFSLCWFYCFAPVFYHCTNKLRAKSAAGLPEASSVRETKAASCSPENMSALELRKSIFSCRYTDKKIIVHLTGEICRSFHDELKEEDVSNVVQPTRQLLQKPVQQAIFVQAPGDLQSMFTNN